MARKRCPICGIKIGMLSLQDHIACGLLGGKMVPRGITRDMNLLWWCLCGFESESIAGLLRHLNEFEHDWPRLLTRKVMESM